MRNARNLWVVVTGLIICAVTALNAGAAGRRPDPNMEKVPSPFRGTVLVAAGTTLTVKGTVKTRGLQVVNGEPRPEPGQQQAKETSVTHTISFYVKPDTKVTRDGKAAQLKDIHAGDMVSVTFSTKEGSSLKHVTEVSMSSTGFSDSKDDAKAGKKKAKE